MERVTFTYGNQRKPLYADFSLAIAAGERVALVGPSGSGKSTFVKLLQRLYDLDAGRILIDGQDIAGVTLESLRRGAAPGPQGPGVFHPPLAGYIRHPRPGGSREKIGTGWQPAPAPHIITAPPAGYAAQQ